MIGAVAVDVVDLQWEECPLPLTGIGAKCALVWHPNLEESAKQLGPPTTHPRHEDVGMIKPTDVWRLVSRPEREVRDIQSSRSDPLADMRQGSAAGGGLSQETTDLRVVHGLRDSER